MESLAMVVVYIALSITAVLMLGMIWIWRIVIRRKFPQLGGYWWFLWVPLLFGLAFLLSLLVLRIVVMING